MASNYFLNQIKKKNIYSWYQLIFRIFHIFFEKWRFFIEFFEIVVRALFGSNQALQLASLASGEGLETKIQTTNFQFFITAKVRFLHFLFDLVKSAFF
jgi:hypothetical protein